MKKLCVLTLTGLMAMSSASTFAASPKVNEARVERLEQSGKTSEEVKANKDDIKAKLEENGIVPGEGKANKEERQANKEERRAKLAEKGVAPGEGKANREERQANLEAKLAEKGLTLEEFQANKEERRANREERRSNAGEKAN